MAPLARHGIPGLRRLPLPPSRICIDPIWRVALLYCALTLLLAYPLTRHPGSHVLSVSADTNLFMWALGWDTHALTHHPLSIFDANIYYPERHTLAYSENFIGSALFAAPILWLTDNPVLAMNTVSLLSCVLCGVGGFVLARRVGVGFSRSRRRTSSASISSTSSRFNGCPSASPFFTRTSTRAAGGIFIWRWRSSRFRP
jgi:hypothetical protein